MKFIGENSFQHQIKGKEKVNDTTVLILEK
jgi:hypothetical protein